MTVYVEAEKAARELGVRARGGFFADDADEDYALALVDGAFAKALVVHLVRKVDGKTFYEARAAPRMLLFSMLYAEMASLDGAFTRGAGCASHAQKTACLLAGPRSFAVLQQSCSCMRRGAGAG